MRKFLQRLLTKPVITLANKWSSRPDKKRVDQALTALYKNVASNPGDRGRVIEFNAAKDRFVVLSDQHKGARDGSDIFAKAADNYLAALDYYNKENFFYINLGDSEELWENTFLTVKAHNQKTFKAEQHFLDRDAFIKIFGNHDLYWDNDPLAKVSLEQIYDKPVKIYEAALLQTTIGKNKLSIYLTHGHQGDLQSDGNWFSKWFVSDIWAPFQSYLHINPNTPSTNDTLKTVHNKMMYEWSARHKNILLITGHTHQPVFRSLTELEILYEKQEKAQGKEAEEIKARIDKLHLKTSRPPDFKGYLDTYFNSGCCCFDDGDITGIEIADNGIRLIKWAYHGKNSVRHVLEESLLKDLKLH